MCVPSGVPLPGILQSASQIIASGVAVLLEIIQKAKIGQLASASPGSPHSDQAFAGDASRAPTLSLFPRQWMIKRPPCMQPHSSAPHVVGKEPAKLVLTPGRPGTTLYQSVTPMYEAFDFYDRYSPTCRRQLQPQLLSPRPRPCLLSPPSMSSSRRRPRASATMCSWHTLQPTLMILRSIQGRILIDTLRQLRRSTRAWACNQWWATPPHTQSAITDCAYRIRPLRKP